MARAIVQGRVTPADELRELLTSAENLVVSVRGNPDHVITLLAALDQIAELWPLLDAQGVDLRSEAGRWETLQAAVGRRAEEIVETLRQSGGMRAVRQRTHPEGTDASWWRLDEDVADRRRRKLRRTAAILLGIAAVSTALYFILRLLFPVDPNVVAASRLMSTGDRLVQDAGDYASALAEFQQAAALTPDDFEVWIRTGVAQEKLGDAEAASQSFERARALIGDDHAFHQARASGYLLLAMPDEAERDLLQILAARPQDAMAWYQFGSVYEARGQLDLAIDALTKASDYSLAANQAELTALARTRLGMIMQRFPAQQGAGAASQTGTP